MTDPKLPGRKGEVSRLMAKCLASEVDWRVTALAERGKREGRASLEGKQSFLFFLFNRRKTNRSLKTCMPPVSMGETQEN